MPSNNSRYTPEFRAETAKYVIESGKSSTSVAEEIGIDKNTVCSWVREYPGSGKGKPETEESTGRRTGKGSHIKKSLHIFMEAQE